MSNPLWQVLGALVVIVVFLGVIALVAYGIYTRLNRKQATHSTTPTPGNTPWFRKNLGCLIVGIPLALVVIIYIIWVTKMTFKAEEAAAARTSPRSFAPITLTPNTQKIVILPAGISVDVHFNKDADPEGDYSVSCRDVTPLVCTRVEANMGLHLGYIGKCPDEGYAPFDHSPVGDSLVEWYTFTALEDAEITCTMFEE